MSIGRISRPVSIVEDTTILMARAYKKVRGLSPAEVAEKVRASSWSDKETVARDLDILGRQEDFLQLQCRLSAKSTRNLERIGEE